MKLIGLIPHHYPKTTSSHSPMLTHSASLPQVPNTISSTEDPYPLFLNFYEARVRFQVSIPVRYGGMTISKKLGYGYSGYIY